MLLSQSAWLCSPACSSEVRGEVAHRPAEFLHQHFHRVALARARVAHVHALALQILEVGDPGIGAGHHGEGLGMQREDRAQLRIGALIGEGALALVGLVLHVRLGHAEVELARAHGVDVVDRAPGAFDGAADPVLGAVARHHPADRAARGIVDAGHGTRADGNEIVLSEGRRRQYGQRSRKRARQSRFPCSHVSFLLLVLASDG